MVLLKNRVKNRPMPTWNIVNFEVAFSDFGPAAIVGIFVAVGGCWAKENDPTRVGARPILLRRALERDPDRQAARRSALGTRGLRALGLRLARSTDWPNAGH